eukprot:CAMPEP_0175526016 /NCGR_PEP_ID=MMETSP0096-20121207/19402_1 /TAXON_ID=311494 /ORGANISM="Alexandrium monilatum, Strain CCMP3105" /LENGTH=60 /DNA_ID=CAMNT_0016828641 /DNA_START=54 /DNA_END=233 /DNA_ORIENTATION=+
MTQGHCIPRLRGARPRSRRDRSSAGLLHGHVDEVLVLQPELLRRVVRRDALAVNHEAHLR